MPTPAPQLGERIPVNEFHLASPIEASLDRGHDAAAVPLGTVLGMVVEPALQVEWPAFGERQIPAGLGESAQDARHGLVRTGGQVAPCLRQVHRDDVVDGLALPRSDGPN
jgi:hypothetical protein